MILTSKSDVWSHEQEWRIVCETENNWLPFDCISGIYLGQRKAHRKVCFALADWKRFEHERPREGAKQAPPIISFASVLAALTACTFASISLIPSCLPITSMLACSFVTAI